MIRRILVALDETPFTAVAVQAAAELARRHDATVTGVATLDRRRAEQVGPVPIGAGIYAERLRRYRVCQAQEHLDRVVESLQRACAAEGVECTVAREEGRVAEAVAAQARSHDLLLLGAQTTSRWRGRRAAQALVAKASQSGARPLLAISREYRPVQRALVAYSGSAESAQAMRAFLQLRLWPEAAVKIVTGGRSPRRAAELLNEAAEYCRAHGWEPEVAYLPGPLRDNLLSETSRWQPDVMVTGDEPLPSLLRAAAKSVAAANQPLFVAS